MGQFVLLLITTLTSFHPQSPILCKQYYPGTNHVVPRNITFNYTPQQKVLNNLRCYCETVKPLELQCIDHGYSRDDCRLRSERWASSNLINRDYRQGQLANVPIRRNVIINVQP